MISEELRAAMRDWDTVTDMRCPACGKRIDIDRVYEAAFDDGEGAMAEGKAAEMVLFMENETEIHIDVIHETMTRDGDVPEYIGPRGKPDALQLAFAIADGERMCPLVFPKALTLRGFVAHRELTRKETA